MELKDLDGVGPATVESLEEQNITSIDNLAESDIETIAECGMSEDRASDLKYTAKQNTITIQSVNEVEEEYESNKTITTGIPKLDEAIEGGWEQEAVVSIYGDSSTGKTQLCMQALVEAVRDTGQDAVYIETEKNRFRPERIENICGGYDDIEYNDVLGKIHRVKAHDLDKQLSAYSSVANEFSEIAIVVIDSLVAQFRLSDQFADRSDLGKRSNLIGKHLKKIEKMAEKLQCPALFTNQIYEVPDTNPYQSVQIRQYGGKKIQYVAQYSILMEEGAGNTFVCNVEAHPSTGDSEVNILIKEDGIEPVTGDE